MISCIFKNKFSKIKFCSYISLACGSWILTWIKEVCSPITNLLRELRVGEDGNLQKTGLSTLKADPYTDIHLEFVLIRQVINSISEKKIINIS